MNADTSNQLNVSRSVLTDVTNQQGKRPYSSNSSSLKSMPGVENGDHGTKQNFTRVENSLKENCVVKNPKVTPEIRSVPLKAGHIRLQSLHNTGTLQGGTRTDIPRYGCENKQDQHSASIKNKQEQHSASVKDKQEQHSASTKDKQEQLSASIKDKQVQRSVKDNQEQYSASIKDKQEHHPASMKDIQEQHPASVKGKQEQHSASIKAESLFAAGHTSQSCIPQVGVTVKEINTAKESSAGSLSMSESTKSCKRIDGEDRSKCQVEETIDVDGADCILDAVCSQRHDAVCSHVVDESKKPEMITSPGKSIPCAASLSLTEVEGSKSFGLVKCAGLKGDTCSSSTASLDSLKDCSCSFCMKAAYILSDLHYQDAKGRISVLTKSQKEANALSNMYSGENDISKQGQGNLNKLPRLEVDLISQWKSLFHRMEDLYDKENSQLENSLSSLKEMRESYKMNLEVVNGSSSDVQQCSSDASNDQRF